MATVVNNRSAGLDVDLGKFQAAARRWAQMTNKTQAEVLRTSAKMTLSNPRQGSGLLQITPPCSQGRTGLDGKRAGEAAIEKDLKRHFVPVLGRGIGPRGDDPASIHAVMFQFKRPGRPLRRNRAQPYFVDAAKLRALEKLLKSRVGFLASGWTASARALGASVPSWVARHGIGRGTIRMSFTAPRYSITMVSFAPQNSPWQELERRVGYALSYATNNLERQIRYQLEKDAGRCGFDVR